VRVSSFVSIGPAVWPAIRNKQTDKQTNITPFIIQINSIRNRGGGGAAGKEKQGAKVIWPYSGIAANWRFRLTSPLPVGGPRGKPCLNVTWVHMSEHAKWHLIPSNGFSMMLEYEYDRRHTYRRTDHALVTRVAIGETPFSDAAYSTTKMSYKCRNAPFKAD